MSAVKIILIIVGVLLILASIGPFAFGGLSMATYFGSTGTMEDNKKQRDAVEAAGGDTTAMDKQIESDEDLMSTKLMFMGICLPLGIVLLIVGVVLIIVGVKKGKKAAAPPPAPPPQQPQQQDPYGQWGQPQQDPYAQYNQPQQNPQAQYGQPSQQQQQWGQNQGPPRQGY